MRLEKAEMEMTTTSFCINTSDKNLLPLIFILKDFNSSTITM